MSPKCCNNKSSACEEKSEEYCDVPSRVSSQTQICCSSDKNAYETEPVQPSGSQEEAPCCGSEKREQVSSQSVNAACGKGSKDVCGSQGQETCCGSGEILQASCAGGKTACATALKEPCSSPGEDSGCGLEKKTQAFCCSNNNTPCATELTKACDSQGKYLYHGPQKRFPPSCCATLKKSCDSPREQSCCGSGSPAKSSCSKSPTAASQCFGTSCSPIVEDFCPASGCCSAEEKQPYKSSSLKISEARHRALEAIDVEKGPREFEHAIITVEGMTCTGCETKLSKSLSLFPSVSRLQTSLVLSRAEFDVDIGIISVADLISQLRRMTGFNCERITGSGHELDVLRDRNSELYVSQSLPIGVTDMALLDQATIRIHYDANTVGARDLLEKGFKSPLQLALPRPDPSIAAANRHVRKVGLMTLLSTVLTIPVLILTWAPLKQREDHLYDSISFALSTIIQVVIAGPFYPSAINGLIFSRVIEMDLLIVLSTSAAYVFSVVSYVYNVRHEPLSIGEFFETSTLLVTLIMLGRFVGALARQKAVESISIRSLQATTALLVTEDGKCQKEIDARLLQYRDVFRVVPESRVVTDGVVISGTSEMDESMVTGEAKLVEKMVASPVIAGSVNGSGLLDVRVSRLPGDNTISTIANMVDEAKLSKPKTQELADRVAGYFVPVVFVITIIVFVIWVAIGTQVRNKTSSEAIVDAITYAIAVLIVSCPCALGLAVPMVIVVAGGVAADNGAIFKTADTIDLARKVTHVVFDKTGTLTQGKLTVSAEMYLNGSKGSVAPILLGLISNIKHPVSAAVANHLRTQGVAPAWVEDTKTLPGKGVEGTAAGMIIRAGNSGWLGVEFLPQVQSFLSRELTVFCVVINNDLRAVFGLEDSLRPDAALVVSTLISRCITVSLVSGDDSGAVQSVATQLNISPSNTRSRSSPSAKQKYVQDLLTNDKEVVVFVGDGTNDAVALAQASIGVHVNEGTDVAQSAADAVLTRPMLSGILMLIDLSRAAYARIFFNFFWALVYNVFAILLAAGAFVNARIPPQYAGLGEIVSVLPVIAIALQLRYVKFGRTRKV